MDTLRRKRENWPQNEAKIPSMRQPKAVCNADLIKQRPVLNLKKRSWPRSTWQDKGERQSQSCSNMRRHCNCNCVYLLGIGKSVPKIVSSVTDLVRRSCASSFRTDVSTTHWAQESHHEKKVRGEIRRRLGLPDPFQKKDIFLHNLAGVCCCSGM